MIPLSKENFLTDESGNKIGVVIDMTHYKKMLEDSEELESIKAYDQTKQSNDQTISFDQATKEIEKRA